MPESQNEQIDLADLEPVEEVKGSGTITKVGAGTLVLTNANTYRGTTVRSTGNLQLAGALTVTEDL